MIHYLEEVKLSTSTGIWKKRIPALVGGFEGFKTAVEEVTANVGETAGEAGSEVQPEDGTELLESRDQT